MARRANAAESLGRIIGALQRQLDETTARLSHTTAVPSRAGVKTTKRKKTKKTKSARKTSAKKK